MFISPLFTPDQILKRYPPVSIICGYEDPIYDHSLFFGHRLETLKSDIKLFRVKDMSHGFMGLYLRNNVWMKELRYIVEQIKEELIFE